ncbi:MAG: PocR ligand-binding domain-containing protein [Clostridia bacterium]|nr:PocR ligand-binding domain-containing protein [Clostridia bacterium]
MNKEKIISILRELYAISGFRISLHNTNFEEIAAYPEEKLGFCSYIQRKSERELESCHRCDRSVCEQVLKSGEPIIYRCRHNLVEAISPLYNFGVLTGFLMMGQVRVEGEGIDPMLIALAKLGKKDFEAREICASIPSVKNDMIKSYVNIMTVCASYLTLSNAVTSTKATIGQLTMRYISENFTEHITVKDICDAVGYSKSTVLSAFKKEFSTTVNTYLTDMRLKRSKKMLENDDSTINEIALACGFSDQSYFSKVFSAKYGMTPTEYRREK